MGPTHSLSPRNSAHLFRTWFNHMNNFFKKKNTVVIYLKRSIPLYYLYFWVFFILYFTIVSASNLANFFLFYIILRISPSIGQMWNKICNQDRFNVHPYVSIKTLKINLNVLLLQWYNCLIRTYDGSIDYGLTYN